MDLPLVDPFLLLNFLYLKPLQSKKNVKIYVLTLHSKAVNIGVVGIWEGKNFRVDNICWQPGHI